MGVCQMGGREGRRKEGRKSGGRRMGNHEMKAEHEVSFFSQHSILYLCGTSFKQLQPTFEGENGATFSELFKWSRPHFYILASCGFATI